MYTKIAKLLLAYTRCLTFRIYTLDQLCDFSHCPLQFDMIHVTPPQGPIDALKGSPLSDAAGFVDINQYTMQHKTLPNVFALGDCSNAPISKTAAAIAGQSAVLRKNLMAIIGGQEPSAKVSFSSTMKTRIY